uniref:SWIM zinc finger family protein n=1 Tax=Oscillibacter sp. TaxID=1945593 RepID=UPI0028A2CD53
EIFIAPPFDMSAQIKSSSEEIYHTTLYKCSCPDFSRRNIVCKHMFRLAMEVGLLFNLSPKRLEADVQALLDKQVKLAHDIDKSKKKTHPK